MTNFESFGLPAALNACLTRMNYTTATPVQAQAIPSALQGRDVLGTAQTGTGKTAAFCIPLVNHLMNNPKATALVMTPTRELATQVMTVAQAMAGREHNIRTALLIGGDSMVKQFKQLNNRPRIIIGTPGRINDHLRRNRDMLENAEFLVLDEADRMLDMGFTVQIDEVLKHLPAQRQTLMFSATMPQKIAEFAKRYMKNPERVAVAYEQATADNITHEIKHITSTDAKYNELVNELTARDGSIIIFVKTKRNADRMATRLQKDAFQAEAIHGDLKQSRRDRVIREFRDKKHRILVATDVAARGLDVPHVEHVINYDLPQVAEDYIHRIGRTARAGAKGNAMCFLMPSDASMWSEIHGIMNPGEKREGQFESRRKPGQRLERNRGRNRNQFKDRKREFNREDRPQGEKRFNRDERPQGEKRFNREDRPYGKKRFNRDERPQGEKKFFNKSRSYEDARREDGSADESRFNNAHHSGEDRRSKGEYGQESQKRQYGQKREGGQKRFYNEGKPRGEKRFDREDRPQGEKRFNRNDRPQGEKRFNNDKPRDGAKRFNREDRPQGEKRSYGDKKPGGSANPYRRSKNWSKNKSNGRNKNPDKGLFRAA